MAAAWKKLWVHLDPHSPFIIVCNIREINNIQKYSRRNLESTKAQRQGNLLTAGQPPGPGRVLQPTR
jgi:hypothetical protein